MYKYIRNILNVSLLIVLFPFTLMAEEDKIVIPEKPHVPDSILRNVFQFSPFYSHIIDEYKADVYLKGRVKVQKRNKLVRYIPSMFRLEEGVDDYFMESVSEMHYAAPDIYNRKVKAVSSTFGRNRGGLTDLANFLNMNIYSSSMMSDRLLSPLDIKCSKYYTYLLDTIAGDPDNQRFKILILPKFKSTQLVKGYLWVSDQIWSIREVYFEGAFDMIEFKLKNIMGEEGDEEFLPVRLNLDVAFKFMGNHLNMNVDAFVNYNKVSFYRGDRKDRLEGKARYDLSEFYRLSVDSTSLVSDMESIERLRPIPLRAEEDSLYQSYLSRKDTLVTKSAKPKKKLMSWERLGDVLISSYDVNLSEYGNLRFSPIFNPVMLSYSHSRGISYKQQFNYTRFFSKGRSLRITPQVGYNFTRKELYVSGNMEYRYMPEKMASWEVEAGNGPRIYSSIVLDKLKSLSDVKFNFDDVELDYFKDIYLNAFHNIEPLNGLFVKAGVSMHWRYMAGENSMKFRDFLSQMTGHKLNDFGIRSYYNSFAPRIRIEWTPEMYYYMNGRRKVNVGSNLPTFIVDYERGLKGVFGSNDSHERWEFDVQQKLKLGQLRTLAYRAGFGLFTKMDNVYFVDFANFARSNLPEGWNDEIGGTFQLLDGRFYNSSRNYLRGNVSYESPFILLRPLNRLIGMVQYERLYGGVLFMPHLNPYIELGYGIGTHVFDVGAFVSVVNGRFDTIGFKFSFELFNK